MNQGTTGQSGTAGRSGMNQGTSGQGASGQSGTSGQGGMNHGGMNHGTSGQSGTSGHSGMNHGAAGQSGAMTGVGGPMQAAGNYPPCSRTVTDSCIQTNERGRRRR
jgi:hypothetical protein